MHNACTAFFKLVSIIQIHTLLIKYKPMKIYYSLLPVLSFFLAVQSCKKKNTSEVPAVIITESTALKSVSSFPLGIQCYNGILDFPVPAQRVSESYDRLTAADFYWGGVEPSQGVFDFTGADKTVAFAQAYGLHLHGHPLVYFQNGVSPAYVNSFSGTKADFESMVKNHIQTIVNRYRGKFKSYDVVNEMAGNFRGTGFFNNAMEQFYNTDAAYIEFIGKCFTWAHEADPAAKLFYNEAMLEISNYERLNVTVNLANTLKASGIPIHGVGTQMHTDIYCPAAVIENVLVRLASTGLLVHISELDVSVNNNSNTGENFSYTSLSPALAEQQKNKYKAIAASYKRYVPVAQQWGITLWDLMDHTTWLRQYRNEWPCLYDSLCNKKPAYIGFGEGLAN